MGTIYPIPSNRSSDLQAQQRLLAQIQSDQRDLLRIQTQISTGRRIVNPSDDPQAAGRAISLQRILEEKTQSLINLGTTNSYLSATDTALSSVSDIVTQMRGLAVSAAQTTISDQERAAIGEQIQAAITQLVNLGNFQFRGRYLFAGSQTTQQPFSELAGMVAYHGNSNGLSSYADTDYVFQSNISGNDVFGAVSPGIHGIADLNPILTENTKLSDLRGGFGISKGSFIINDGSNSQTIDISSAETIGDVVRIIEKNPPVGRTVTVDITRTGLNIQLDVSGGGNLRILEAGGGTTAAELGIKNINGVGTSPIVGTDLNPNLTLTTRLADLLGTRPQGTLVSTGQNNNLLIESNSNGTAGNGVNVQFVNDALLHALPGLLPGNETVNYSATATPARASLRFSGFNNNLLLTGNSTGTSLNNVRIDVVNAGAIGNSANVNYNSSTKVLTIGVDALNNTTIQSVINAINAEGTFQAGYDSSDPTDGGLLPVATVSASDAQAAFGNTGNSGGAAKTLFVRVAAGQTTANDVIRAINNDPTVGQLFTASLAPHDTTTLVNAGLGAVDINATTTLNGGGGADLDLTSGFIVNNGGQSYTIDISQAATIEDVLNILNNSDANIVATLGANGTGIDVRSRLSGGDFSIGENGGTTATQLGIRSFTTSTRLSDLNYGNGVPMITGADFRITRSDGTIADIDLDPSADATVQDVLNKINAAGGVTARLKATGNGIEIQDNTGGSGPLTISRTGQSEVVWTLGLVPLGQDQTSVSGSPKIISGRDPNPQEVKGVFNSLARLQEALRNFNLGDIERAAAMLDDDLSRLNFSRSGLGTKLQTLDVLKSRVDDEQLQLKTNLSDQIDIDLPQAISDMVARQAALEASLRLTAQVFQLSLLNFL